MRFRNRAIGLMAAIVAALGLLAAGPASADPKDNWKTVVVQTTGVVFGTVPTLDDNGDEMTGSVRIIANTWVRVYPHGYVLPTVIIFEFKRAKSKVTGGWPIGANHVEIQAVVTDDSVPGGIAVHDRWSAKYNAKYGFYVMDLTHAHLRDGTQRPRICFRAKIDIKWLPMLGIWQTLGRPGSACTNLEE